MQTRRLAVALLAVVSLSGCATTQATASTALTIDTFGSTRLTPEALDRHAGPAVRRWVRALDDGDAQQPQLKQALVEDLARTFDLADVDLSLVTYRRTGLRLLTVDVVERADAATRLAFSPEPTEELADPGGLIEQWDAYAEANHAAHPTGSPAHVPCPVWHCLNPFDTPTLATFLKTFNEQVPLHEAELAAVLTRDARQDRRAKAIYLLAHLPHAEQVVGRALGALTDSSSWVRQNAARVLWAMVDAHPEVDVPLAPGLTLLNDPATTARSKGCALVAALAQNHPALRPTILREAGPTLLALLRLNQPINHDCAFEVLRTVSGQPFGDRDVDAWARWLSTVTTR